MRNLIIFGGISIAALSLAAVFAVSAADAQAEVHDLTWTSVECDGAEINMKASHAEARAWTVEHCTNFSMVAGEF